MSQIVAGYFKLNIVNGVTLFILPSKNENEVKWTKFIYDPIGNEMVIELLPHMLYTYYIPTKYATKHF